jgi:RpiB/LacA/LacB family sugar-phosphate isomerase
VPHRDVPSADEIRALVERVVDGAVSATAAAGTVGPAPSSPSPPVPSVESIAVGADHGGFPLKERLAFRLREQGHTVVDCGTDSTEAVDYPDFARAVAERVAAGECRWGIVVDGAGIGSAMVANKVPGVRAALCYDISSARNSREHNHANVLTLGAGLIGEGLAWQIVREWLDTPWGEGRHARRVAMIDALDHDRVRAGEPS